MTSFGELRGASVFRDGTPPHRLQGTVAGGASNRVDAHGRPVYASQKVAAARKTVNTSPDRWRGKTTNVAHNPGAHHLYNGCFQ